VLSSSMFLDLLEVGTIHYMVASLLDAVFDYETTMDDQSLICTASPSPVDSSESDSHVSLMACSC